MTASKIADEDHLILSLPPNQENFSKIRILKNAFVLSAGFIIFFTAYDALGMLQSTINAAGGVGVASQAVIYACFSISALLLPKYVIQKLGCKATLILSMLCYVPYIASNFYPHWATLIPSAALLGLSASLLWGTQCTYLNELSMEYAKLSFQSIRKSSNASTKDYSSFENHDKHILASESGMTNHAKVDEHSTCKVNGSKDNCNHNGCDAATSECQVYTTSHSSSKPVKPMNELNFKDKMHQNSDLSAESTITNSTTTLLKLTESTNARFFGVFGMAYLSTHALSNMMSYFILAKNNVSYGNGNFSNFSCNCGPNFCSADSFCISHNTEELNISARNILTGVCTALSLFSIVLIVFFLDNVHMEKKPVTFSLDLLMATLKLSRKKEQLFLTPLSFYVGMIQGFFASDFTKSYIGCAWGTNAVSLVSICYGIACSLSSTLSGYLVSAVGRVPTFIGAELVNVAANVLLLMWNPDPSVPWMFFIAAGLWGTFVGTFFSQHRAFYGILFKANEEAGFAAFYLWYSLGFCLSFAYSNYLCVYVKIYILLSVSTVGIIGYLYVELFLQNHKNKK